MFLVYPPYQSSLVRLFIKFQKGPIYIEFDRIRWNFSNTIEVQNLLLIQKDTSQSLLFRVDTLRITYSSFNLLRKNLKIHRLFLDHPSIDLHPSPEYYGPPVPKSHRGFSQFNLIVDELEIQEGHISLPEQDILYLNLNASASYLNKALEVTIDSLSLLLPGRGFIESLEGSLSYQKELIVNARIVLPNSRFHLDFRAERFSPLVFETTIIGDSINITEVDTFIGMEALEGEGKAFIHVWGEVKNQIFGEVQFTGILLDERYRDSRTDFRFKDQVLNISDFDGYLRDSRIAGDLTLDFQGEFPRYWGEFRIKQVDLRKALIDSSISPTRFTGIVSFRGSGLQPDINRMVLEAQLSEGTYDILPFDTAAGQIRVTPDSLIFMPVLWFQEGQTSLFLEGYIIPQSQMDLRLGADSRDLSQFLSALGIEIQELQGAGKMEGTIYGNPDNPLFRGKFDSDSLKINTIVLRDMETSINLDQLQPKPAGDIEIIARGNLNKIKFDSLYSKLELTPERLRIKPFIGWGDSIMVKGIGTLHPIDSPEKNFFLEGLRLFYKDNLIEITEQVDFSISDSLIASDNLNFSCFGGSVFTALSYNPQKGLKIQGELVNLQLDSLSNLVPLDYELKGKINSDFSLFLPEQTESLTAHISFSSPDFTIEDVEWKSTSGKIHLQKGVLNIDSLFLYRPRGEYSFSGKVDWFDTLHPFYFEATGEDQELTLANIFLPIIEHSRGNIKIDLKASGHLDSVVTEGNLTLSEGSLDIEDLAYPIEGVSMELILDNSIVTIKQIEGYIEGEPIRSKSIWERVKRFFTGQKKVRGDFSASGIIDISDLQDPQLNLDFNCLKLPLLLPKQGIYAKFSSQGNISLNEKKLAIAGDFDLNEVNLIKLFSENGRDSLSTLPDLNLNIYIPNNFWILTKEIEAELQGEILVTTVNNELNILGELEIIRGNYKYPGASFTIQKGYFYFHNLDEINPELDIEARTLAYDQYVYLKVTGTLKQPELHLSTENPEYTERDAIALLTLNMPLDGRADSLTAGDFLQERTRSLMEAYLQAQVQKPVRDFLGVETFEINPDDENQFQLEKTEITLGKYLTDDIYISYSRQLSTEETGKLKLEYRLGRHSTIQASRDETGYYKIDLKLKWEF
ncbi:translocation/assembly module TamB domain-containing protein [bacterium]|nr:translocation/assembly module TamB domain-containing protein [bacterium]